MWLQSPKLTSMSIPCLRIQLVDSLPHEIQGRTTRQLHIASYSGIENLPGPVGHLHLPGSFGWQSVVLAAPCGCGCSCVPLSVGEGLCRVPLANTT